MTTFVGSPAAAAGIARTSLLAYARRLAQRLNSLTLVTTTSAGNTQGTTLVATGLAGGLDPQRHRQSWVYIADGPLAGQVRRVGEQGLNVLSGALTVTVPFSAQVPTGTTVEIHKLLPPRDDHDGWRGLKTCINLALAECWTVRRLSLAGVADQLTYPLDSTWSWLDEALIHEFYDTTDASVPPIPYPGYDVVQDGASLSLQVAPLLGATDSGTLGVTQPLDTRIKRAGAWQDVDDGLQDDTDEGLLAPGPLVQVALVHAYEALAVGEQADAYQQRATRQRVLVNSLKAAYLPHPQSRPSHGLRGTRHRGPKSWDGMFS